MNDDLISRDAVLDACSQSINILDAMSRIDDLPSVTPKPCEDAISRQAAIDIISGIDRHFVKYIKDLPPVTPKQRTGHCKDCKYFEYDSVAKVDGVPLIVAHEICSRWGDGCKTKEDGYCFLFESQESEEGES